MKCTQRKKMAHKIPDTISIEELQALIKATNKKNYRLAMLLGFFQGMRVSEVAGSRIKLSKCCSAYVDSKKENIKGKDKQLNFCSQCKKQLTSIDMKESKTEWKIPPLDKSMVDMERGFLHLKKAKGGKDRDIPIMPELKHYLRHLPVGVCARALQRGVKRLAKKAIGKDIHFHTLRHSSATYYLNKKKIDIRNIQTLLGHSRLDTTQIYTHVTPESLKEAFIPK